MNAPIDHRQSATCVKLVGNNIYGSGEEVREKLRITRQQMPLTITGEESLANHCILDEILSEKKKGILESAEVVDFLKLQTNIS